MSRPTCLYRLFDASDQLLYVGISVSALGRLGEHLTEKSWACDVARTSIEWFQSREEAAASEVAAIVTEAPRYNVHYNRSRPAKVVRPPKGALEEFFGSPITAESMPDQCHDGCGSLHSPIYYPWKWRAGRAHYACDNGHQWLCGWGHSASGDAPEHRRCQHIWVEPMYGALFCCDCDKQIHFPRGTTR